ncbi:hypothetical protein SDC9_204783 [bioreactor metagenome]|uniref:Uncharacterized protein n=1 Tax=bioreactor metagenome TaxID=1076179 RepID=A0A645J2Z2_9ZZZZ
MPRLRNSRNRSMLSAARAIMTLSVISRTREDAGNSLSFSALRMILRRSGCSSCLDDRLIATYRSAMPLSSQALACWQALRRTRSPSGRMRPVSSAIGMNSAGETIPRSGCSQRTSASTPVILPPTVSTTGW